MKCPKCNHNEIEIAELQTHVFKYRISTQSTIEDEDEYLTDPLDIYAKCLACNHEWELSESPHGEYVYNIAENQIKVKYEWGTICTVYIKINNGENKQNGNSKSIY